MGFTRFCHGSRIVAYEPGLFYASSTTEAVAFALRMDLQLGRHSPADTAAAVAVARERELFLSELWLPSHHNYTSVGAVLRVMNYLCFANSKVLFRHLRHAGDARRPARRRVEGAIGLGLVRRERARPIHMSARPVPPKLAPAALLRWPRQPAPACARPRRRRRGPHSWPPHGRRGAGAPRP